MERSLRALVSTRTTALSPTVAMRAREVATPSAADLVEAEAELQIVRRHYVPPAPLATAKKPEQRPAQGRPSEPRAKVVDGRRPSRRAQHGTAG